jgi:hypothetical protein
VCAVIDQFFPLASSTSPPTTLCNHAGRRELSQRYTLCLFPHRIQAGQNEIGLAWLKQVFDRFSKAKARRKDCLLIVSGHGSNVTMDFIKYCDQNKILLAILPPHSTHTKQPLDKVMFKPLSTAYSREFTTHFHTAGGCQ